jgi:hypothetical protein
MAGKLVDQGEADILQVLFKNATQWGTVYIGLYENTTEPAETATLSNLTEETGAGYARVAKSTATWTCTTTQATATTANFTATTAWGSQYGYFICDVASGTSGNLLFVEHFSNGPYDVTNGSSVVITPKITVS